MHAHIPTQTMLRIWDTFLYEGSKVLFRFALAIFKHNEEKILSLDTSIGIFNHLRSMCQDCTEVDRLVQVSRAFRLFPICFISISGLSIGMLTEFVVDSYMQACHYPSN